MRVVLYQPNHEGHHLPYLARLLPGLLDLRDALVSHGPAGGVASGPPHGASREALEVIVATTPEAVASEEYRTSLDPLRDRFQVAPVAKPIPAGVLRGALHRTLDLARVVGALQPDHVGILYGDGIWQLLAAGQLAGLRAVTRRVPTEMWLYRGGFTYPDARVPSDLVKRALFQRLLRSGALAAVHLDDEYLFDYARLVGGPTRVFLTPNPVPTPVAQPLPHAQSRVEARRALGLPADGRLVTLTGMIDHRKGAHLLAAAFARLAVDPTMADVRLAFGGPHRPRLKALLAHEPYTALADAGRLLSVDRFLSQDEMGHFASASDLVVAPYPRHSGRSSVILWAAAAGRPSLGAARGAIGRVIRDHRLGWTVDPTDDKALAHALARALSQPWTPADEARVRAYAATHSAARYAAHGATLVRERLGLPPA